MNMPPSTLRPALAYAAGAGLAALAVALHDALRPWIGTEAPFLFAVPSVVVAAAMLGRGPALLVLLAGAADAVLQYPPAGTWVIHSPQQQFAVGAYLVVGALIVLVGSKVRLTSVRASLAEQRLKLAQDDTGLGVFELDFQGGTAFASAGLCQLLGKPPVATTMPLQQWLEQLDPQHVAESRRVLEEKIARRELRYEREQRIELPDGQVRWLLSRVRLELSAAGRLAVARGATLDITERKRLDERLQGAQVELRQQLLDVQRLHALSHELVAAGDEIAAPLQALLELVIDFHDGRHGLLSLRSPGSNLFSVLAQTGLRSPRLQPGAQIAVAAHADRWQVLAAHRALATQEGLADAHGTPLLSADGEIVGVICVMFAAAHAPSEREQRLSELCASTAAAVIERKRARSAAAENRERFAVALESSAVPFNILAPVRDDATAFMEGAGGS